LKSRARARRSGTSGDHILVAAPIHKPSNPLITKESTMFFAPVLRTRAVVPATRSFDRSFERFVNEAFFSPAAAGVKLQEDEKAWTVTLDVPGIARDDLSINVEGAVVRIETRKEAPRQYKAAYELPQEIDVEATQAKLENGVLTLTLAKQAASKARQIPLN
jgi:HSP20 family protein